MDLDEMAAEATRAALTCDECDHVNADVSAYDTAQSDDGVAVAFYFECDECMAYNENTVTLE
jgi:hypothetical protein